MLRFGSGGQIQAATLRVPSAVRQHFRLKINRRGLMRSGFISRARRAGWKRFCSSLWRRRSSRRFRACFHRQLAWGRSCVCATEGHFDGSWHENQRQGLSHNLGWR